MQLIATSCTIIRLSLTGHVRFHITTTNYGYKLLVEEQAMKLEMCNIHIYIIVQRCFSNIVSTYPMQL